MGRHIAAVLLIAAALTAALVEPELRAGYSWYRASNTGEWTYSTYTDSSGISNTKYAGYNFSDRKMYVMAGVTTPGYAVAKTIAYWNFQYDHDHDWVNQFRISYQRRGLGTCVEGGSSNFTIEFFLEKKSPIDGIYYPVYKEVDTNIKKLNTSLNDQSLIYCDFSWLLQDYGEYRIHVMVTALCSKGESLGSASLDFWNRVTPQQYVKLGSVVVYHYDCTDYAYGGPQQGKRTRLTQRWWQNSFPYADGVSFSSYSMDSKTKKIVGWNATIDGFDHLTGARPSDNPKRVNFNADNTGSECTDVGKGSEIRVDVTHFLDKWSGSGSSMSISSPWWSEGSGTLAMSSEESAIPMHEWGFCPVAGNAFNVSFNKYRFAMSNQDPDNILHIRSLKFLVSSDDYEDLGAIQFDSAATLHDFSVLPLASWSTNVNGRGRYIYFKYSLAYPDSGTVWGLYETNWADNPDGRQFQKGTAMKPKLNGAPYLHQNYPNPFNPNTEIAYNLPQECYVSIEIFDVAGRRVATLVEGMQKAGPNTVRWNGRNDRGIAANSGIYICRLSSGSFVENKKLVLLR